MQLQLNEMFFPGTRKPQESDEVINLICLKNRPRLLFSPPMFTFETAAKENQNKYCASTADEYILSSKPSVA